MKLFIMLAIAPILSILFVLVFVENTRLYIVEELLAQDQSSKTASPGWSPGRDS